MIKKNTTLQKYKDMYKPHKLEAIYNKEYRYIKEIIWDDELNKTLGNTRGGYEKYNKGYVSFSGETSLRTVTKDKEIIGYITETNLTSNVKWSLFREFYVLAKKETYKILEVKDIETFDYWLENSGNSLDNRDYNSYIMAIDSLESIINDYKEDKTFRKFIDKIKE